ncbi:hypothetical protein AOLI_G00155520, partial [Acnodon oligacanthus]
ISLCHFFFNIFGIILWYPIPITRVPIRLAKALGDRTAKYRWFAIVYLILCFFILPLLVLALSIAGWQVLVGIGVPVLTVVVFVVIVNIMQSRCSRFLFPALRSWDFLPKPLHSLKPWDRIVNKVLGFCGAHCCCCCKCCKKGEVNCEKEDGMETKKELEMYDNPALCVEDEKIQIQTVSGTHL